MPGRAIAASTLCCCVPIQALRKVPDVNASWMGDFIRKYHNVDISVAVQTPSGLMVRSHFCSSYAGHLHITLDCCVFYKVDTEEHCWVLSGHGGSWLRVPAGGHCCATRGCGWLSMSGNFS